ncbi:hypothetical protein CJD36_003510 [Flavipsychrobacter stenotrophus]|uniref:DUF4190 domain-containing protein n=2 Tax=Flavipsychrobacter stenotrophus TaxID=2077091 RepID=A0A2S7T0U3_9BACT|nr:hypothetical protein CJD36_003510 [Flavipsychrobacter stenotrophus]
MLILLLSCSISHAAFVVQPIQRTAEASSTTIAAKRTNPLIRMGSSAVPVVKQFFHTHGDRHYHENNETDAILALIFGIVGIFIWPLGIAALILGIRGSYRGNTYSSLGVIGLILGALEIAAMLAVVIFFIVLLAMI